MRQPPYEVSPFRDRFFHTKKRTAFACRPSFAILPPLLQNLTELDLLAAGADDLEVTETVVPETRDLLDAVGADLISGLDAELIIRLDIVGFIGDVIDLALYKRIEVVVLVHLIDGVAAL